MLLDSPETVPLEYKLKTSSQAGKYTLILDSGMKGQHIYTAVHTECDRQPYAVKYPLPAYGTAVFKFSKHTAKATKKAKKHK